ncbi:MAG: hypothetical protein JRI68_13785 [Deltaproteobacteria bacterium]|nr:hypothetical protein [Deltaproteobacteria bacterium]
MDPKRAVSVLLAAAGALAVGEVAAGGPSGPAQAGASGTLDEPAEVGAELADKTKPPRVTAMPKPDDAPPIVMRYGVIAPPASCANTNGWTRAAAQASRVAAALRVVQTPEGMRHAKKAGLTKEKIAAVRAKLIAFDAKAAKLGCSAALPMSPRQAPPMVMKYGIIPAPTSCASKDGLASAVRQATLVAEALRVLATPKGALEAKRAGLSLKKIAEVKAKLKAFDAKVVGLRCPGGG